jgi:hypothetical protein
VRGAVSAAHQEGRRKGKQEGPREKLALPAHGEGGRCLGLRRGACGRPVRAASLEGNMDGAGPADLVYVGPDRVRYDLNQSANGFGEEHVVRALPGVFPDPGPTAHSRGRPGGDGHPAGHPGVR